MPEFNLTDDEIQRLQAKFQEFKRNREKVHELLNDYVADYRQFDGTSEERYKHLQRKFISKSPDLSHLISINGSFLWSVNDISIVLGRHRTTIQRSLDKMENSEGWCAKLLALRETSKASSGLKIYVYHQEIFDLILDLYEEEYLLRFSEPRKGNIQNAPDIHEVRRFWNYLKDFDSVNDFAVYEKKVLPDIPPMSVKDIFSLIWNKVFNIKIDTVCSVVFAVCFEIARRFFGVHLWLAVVPAVIAVICVLLIHRRKFSPDTLSNFGAGALLFTLLWISAALSVDRLKTEPEKIIPDIELVPLLADTNINFNINSNVENVKEYFYRISPDKNFHSTGFIRRINENESISAPSTVIINRQLTGTADIDVKFLDSANNESSVWHFSVDMASERFKIYKQFILNSETAWIYARYYKFDDTTRIRISNVLFSPIAGECVEDVIYSINNSSLDTSLNFSNYYKLYKKGNVFDPYTISSIEGNNADIRSIFSRVIFKDGSSSDIRISKVPL